MCDAFVNKQRKGFRGAGLALRSIGFKRLMSDWFLLFLFFVFVLFVFRFCFLFVLLSFLFSFFSPEGSFAVRFVCFLDASVTVNYIPLQTLAVGLH